MSGVSAVFSIEFFKDCYSHLNKGGIMVQWIQSYEMDDDTFKMILNTFSSVFPEVTIWNLGMGDNLIIGSNDKIIIDFNESEERMGQEEIKKDLARVKVYDLFTLLNFQVTSAPNIKKAIIRGGTINSDYFPLLEYKAPLALYTGSFVDDLTYLDERRLPFERGNLFIKEYLKYNKIEQDNFKNLFEYIKKHSVYNKNLIFSLVKRWHTDYPESKEASLAFASYNLEALDREIIMLENLMNNDKEFKYLYHYADLQIEKYDKLRSYLIPELFFDMEHKLDNLINLSGEDKTKFYYQIGKYFLDKKNYNDALHYLDRTEKLIESQSSAKSSIDYIGLLNNISFAYLESGEHGKAEAYAEKVLLLDKNDSFAQTILLNIGVQKGY